MLWIKIVKGLIPPLGQDQQLPQDLTQFTVNNMSIVFLFPFMLDVKEIGGCQAGADRA